jgi:hypothetical protein
VDTIPGHEKFAAQVRQAKFHQFDEITLIVHNQDARHHTPKT